MTHNTADLISATRWGAGQGVYPMLTVQSQAPSDMAEGLLYHTARSIEELDRAKASAGSAACQAHEQLAFLHLKEASKLKRGGLSDIVADWVD